MTGGRITKEYWISCGICLDERVLDVPRPKTPAKSAREQGYKLTRKFGWICPKCKEEQDAKR